MKKLVLLLFGLALILTLGAPHWTTDAQGPEPTPAPPSRPPFLLEQAWDTAPATGLPPGIHPPVPASSVVVTEYPQMGDPAEWTRLVFQSYRDSHWEIYSARGDGTNSTRLTRNAHSDIYPRLNRGGTHVVLASNRDGSYELYRMNADGTGQMRLTNNSADDANPAWSPDGSRIAFQSYRDGQAEIYVMNADGGGQRRLTFNADLDATPAWSPDGTQIAFTSRRTGSYRIWVMNADGSNQRQLSDQPYSENPAWSPDGTQIAYDADGDGDGWQELWLMDAGGSNQRQVFEWGGNQDVWVRSWAPYGESVAYTRAQWFFYKGTWYLISSDVCRWSPFEDTCFQVSGGVEMYPDWQTRDALKPTVTLYPLPPYARDGIGMCWYGEDQGGSLVRGYDVQYQKLPDTAWIGWQMDTFDQCATFENAPGFSYRFRARARDNAHNVGRWTAPAGADTVTFYSWAVSGEARDARGAPLSGVLAQTSPPTFETNPSDWEGAYSAYVAGSVATYDVSWSKPGYTGLPVTSLSGGQDAEFADVVLPADDNVVSNWGFESGAFGAADWIPGGDWLPTVSTSGSSHTGSYMAQLQTSGTSGTGGNTVLQQAVEIPANMTHPTLSFMHFYESETPTDEAWFEVQLEDGSQAHSLFKTSENWYRWQHAWVDVSPWAGQTVTLYFLVYQSPGAPRAWTYLDEVSVASAYPNLWITKRARPRVARPGAPVVYQIAYGNRGAVTAQDVQVRDTLPAGMTYLGADPAPDQVGPTLVWEVGELAASSGPATIVVTGTLPADAPWFTTVGNVVRIESVTAEADTSDNQAEDETLIGIETYLPLLMTP